MGATPTVPAPKMSVQDFASKIKEKYPSYAGVGDSELVQKIVAKYPQYQNQVDLSTQSPMMSATPQSEVDAQRNAPYKSRYQAPLADRVAKGMTDALPIVGMTVGGMMGGPLGAAAGAGLGEIGREKSPEGKSIEPLSPKKIAEQTAMGGVSELGGKVLTKGLEKGAAALAPKAANIADKLMVKIIKPLAGRVKPGAKVSTATDIAHEVGKVAGNSATLKGLQGRVQEAMSSANKATADIVERYTDSTKKVPLYDILIDKGSKAIENLNDAFTTNKGKTVDQLVDNIRNHAGKDDLSPKEALELRRYLYNDVHWPIGTKGFRDEVYHAINQHISEALSSEDAAAFRANNKVVSRLIKANEAIDNVQYAKMKAAGRMGVGALAGGAVGYKTGGVKGAIEGAGAGAALTSTPTMLGEAGLARTISGAASATAKGLAKTAVGKVVEQGIAVPIAASAQR